MLGATSKLQVIRLVATAIATVGVMAMLFSQPTSGEQQLKPEFNYSAIYNPEFSLDQDLLRCLESTDVLTAGISSPANNSQFYVGNKITFQSNYNYKCADKNLDSLRIFWYADGAQTPFSTNQTSSISNFLVGNHKIRLVVAINGKQAESTISVNVVNLPPKPQPNTPPQVSIIRPKQNSSFPGNQTCGRGINCAKVTLGGQGTDKEDGTLSGNRLNWYLVTAKGDQFIGSGTPTADLRSTSCQVVNYTIKLVGTDSGGLRAETKVNISVTDPYCIR